MRISQRICLSAVLVIAALVLAWPQAVFAGEDEAEHIVTFKQLPKAVRLTLQRESAGGNLGTIEKETEDGSIVYEAELTLDGRKYEIEVAENGVLLKKELDDDDDEDGDDDDEDEDEGSAQYTRWSFEQDSVGAVPEGWKPAETNGTGKMAVWHVVKDKSAPSPDHAVAITANKNRGKTYNLLMAKNTRYKDVEIEVNLKAVAGKEDQGGGPIWRAKDANNYYVCRWNPLEDNFRLYYVKNSKRIQLASAQVNADSSVWHKIEIEHIGNRIEAEFDGKKLIELEDSTFTKPGMVGVWVKADGRSEFDSIKAAEISEEGPSEDDDDK